VNLEDEVAALLQVRIEQSPAWNEFHDRGSVDAEDLHRVMAVAIAAHREAILRLAREIDALIKEM
jgi:hypothetical protein